MGESKKSSCRRGRQFHMEGPIAEEISIGREFACEWLDKIYYRRLERKNNVKRYWKGGEICM